jgi:hypothetical protein
MNAVADTLRHGVLTAFAEDTASRGNECTWHNALKLILFDACIFAEILEN